MEDPKDIAIRVTTTAKDIVDQARAIATEAIGQSSDVDKYTAAQLADTVTKSVELAFSGALQLNRDVLGVVPKPAPQQSDPGAEGRRLVADAMEAISRRMIRQTGRVVAETADLADKQPYSPTIWVRSMVKLADIALLGGIELAETALIGPAPFEVEPRMSDTYPIGATGEARTLKVADPGLCRPGTADPIPAAQVWFDLPDGKRLAAGATEFRLVVNPAGLISGMYTGKVDVGGGQTVDVEIAV
jgi:hypothetical protein